MQLSQKMEIYVFCSKCKWFPFGGNWKRIIMMPHPGITYLFDYSFKTKTRRENKSALRRFIEYCDEKNVFV